jgi:hypothetical protein
VVTGRQTGSCGGIEARNLLADLGNRASFTCLVRDRASRFTAAFAALLADEEIGVARIAARCPKRMPTPNDSSALSVTTGPGRTMSFDTWERLPVNSSQSSRRLR